MAPRRSTTAMSCIAKPSRRLVCDAEARPWHGAAPAQHLRNAGRIAVRLERRRSERALQQRRHGQDPVDRRASEGRACCSPTWAGCCSRSSRTPPARMTRIDRRLDACLQCAEIWRCLPCARRADVLLAAGKAGLERARPAAVITFFAPVAVDDAGRLAWRDGIVSAGRFRRSSRRARPDRRHLELPASAGAGHRVRPRPDRGDHPSPAGSGGRRSLPDSDRRGRPRLRQQRFLRAPAGEPT